MAPACPFGEGGTEIAFHLAFYGRGSTIAVGPSGSGGIPNHF